MNKAVAVTTDSSDEVIATQFWQRVGVDILRGNCRAFHWRLVGKHAGVDGGGDPFRGVLGLHMVGGV